MVNDTHTRRRRIHSSGLQHVSFVVHTKHIIHCAIPACYQSQKKPTSISEKADLNSVSKKRIYRAKFLVGWCTISVSYM